MSSHLAKLPPDVARKLEIWFRLCCLQASNFPKHSKSLYPPPICISHQTIACFQMKTREVYKKIQLLYGKHGSGNKRLHLFLMRFVPVKIIRKTFRTQHEWNMMWWNVSDSGVRRKLCKETSSGMELNWTLGSMVFLCAIRKQLERRSFFSWAGKRKNGERTENYYNRNRFCLLSSPHDLTGADGKQCAPCMRSTKAAFTAK